MKKLFFIVTAVWDKNFVIWFVVTLYKLNINNVDQFDGLLLACPL